MNGVNPAVIIVVVAAVLIVVGRINGRNRGWTPVWIVGFVLLALAALLQFIRTR